MGFYGPSGPASSVSYTVGLKSKGTPLSILYTLWPSSKFSRFFKCSRIYIVLALSTAPCLGCYLTLNVDSYVNAKSQLPHLQNRFLIPKLTIGWKIKQLLLHKGPCTAQDA